MARPGQPSIPPRVKITLDGITASVAWSVNDLVFSAYTGSLFRVRRSSDNTETDIGFDTFGLANTASLATFCGANNGFVTKVYDQSGNSRDVSQTTSSLQPKIYDSTTGVLKVGQNVSMLYDGTDDRLTRADSSGFTGNPDITVAALWKPELVSIAPGSKMAVSMGGAAANTRYSLYVGALDRPAIDTNGSGFGCSPVATGPGFLNYVVMQHVSGGNVQSITLRQNGSSIARVGGVGLTNNLNIVNTSTYLGAEVDNTDSMSGSITAVVIFALVPSTAQLAQIESWLEFRRLYGK